MKSYKPVLFYQGAENFKIPFNPLVGMVPINKQEIYFSALKD